MSDGCIAVRQFFFGSEAHHSKVGRLTAGDQQDAAPLAAEGVWEGCPLLGDWDPGLLLLEAREMQRDGSPSAILMEIPAPDRVWHRMSAL